MKRTSTPLEMLKKTLLLFICFTTITLFHAKLYGQAKERVYASSQTEQASGLCIGCNVVDATSAVDGNPQTNSRINLTVGALGANVWQELKFSSTNLPAGTQAVIKIGSGEKALTANVLGGVKIQAYNTSNSKVGPEYTANSGLLKLLALGNQSEIFLPLTQPFNRIRVTVDAGLLGAIASIDVYDAYYLINATNANCDAPIDEIHGMAGDVGSLGGVKNGLNAIDGSEATYSTLEAAVGLLGYTQQTIVFPGLSAATDSVRLVISTGANLVSAQLLNGIAIETFNGSASNGVVDGGGGLLKLRLLSSGSNLAIVTFAPGQAFDRVQLRAGGVLNVLQEIRLHEVSRAMALPTSININDTASATGIACMGDGITLKITSAETGATYRWYTQANGGTAISTGNEYTPTGLASGVYNFYVSGQRTGCTNETPRKLVRVVVNNPTLPVVSTTNIICAGSAITLKVTTPVVGESYRWYDVETGGDVLFTGADFTTPVLTAGKSYYVESFIGDCVSARTKVDVTVNPIPGLADIITNNVTISIGQKAVLVAAPKDVDAGSTIYWYTQATGGSPVATGNTYNTPSLTVAGSVVYYAEVRSAGGCISPTRVAVTVNVTNIDSTLACNVANSQTNGIGGLLCVLCGVTNPTGAIDADPATFSTLRVTVGVGSVVYQRLIFGKVGNATDSIRLDLETPGGLADVNVLGGLTINVMRNGAVVKSYPSSSLLHLTLLSGNRYKVTLGATLEYDAVEVRLAGVATALTSVNVYGAEVIYANPTIANAGLNVCYGADATITATPAAGTSLKWFAALNGGAALFTGAEFKPTGLTETKTYYIEVSNTDGTCVNAVRMPVTVNVNPVIVFAPGALAKATKGSTYSKQITATGGTPNFTYAVDAGSSLPAGLTMSAAGVISGTPTAVGTFTFPVTVTDSKGCKETASVTLVVGNALAIGTMDLPNGTTNVLYPTQKLPEATGGTGPYTYTATNLPPGLTLNKDTRDITGTPTKAGTYPVKVTVTDKDGNTITQDYSIIVRDPLALATAPLADGTVGVTYPTQKLPAATGGVGPYTYTASNLPPGLTFDPATREITGTPTTAGPYTVAVTVKDGDGKTVTTNYTVNVKSPLVLPVATLPDGNVGVLYPVQTLPAATGGTGPYTYAAPTLPPGLTFDPLTRKISGTPTQSGLFTIPVTVTDKDGTKITTNYSVRVIGALSMPTAALANGTVGTAYAPQTLPVVSGGTAPYTYTAINLPPGLTFNPTTRVISGTPTKGGTYTFPVTAKDAAGNSTTTDYTILVKVAAPTVAAVATCEGETATLTVTAPIAGVIYNWYAATGSTSIATGTSYTTTALTGNTTYYVIAVSGTESSARIAVPVTVRPAAKSAVVSSDQFISSGQSASLQATADAGNTISWFATATGGTALATGNSFITPALTQTTTYYVETRNAAGCASVTRVPVIVNITTGPVTQDCNAANAQASKIESLICIGCVITNPTGSIDADPTTFTTIHLGIANVAGVGYQKLIFGKQGAATDSIRIDMEIPVGLADINLISGGTITVYNGNTKGKVYPMNSSLLSLQLLGGNRIQVTLPAEAAFNAVEIRVGGIATLLSSYNIYGAKIIYPNPTTAATGQTICAGNATTLSATANGGTTLNWYAAATGGASLGAGETFTTPVLTATTTYYIEVSKAGCANTQRVPVTVNVTAAPTAPVVATVLPVCYGSTTSIAVNNPSTGVEYKWYTVATAGTAVFTGPTFVTPALLANTTYYVESTNPGCGVSSRTAVPVTVNPIVALPQVQASATTVGTGQTVILSVNPITPDVTYNWYTSATETTPVYTGPVFVTPGLTANTTYFVEAKSDLTGCVSTSRVQVTINVNNGGNPTEVPCERATTQTNAVNGIALISGVFNEELAVDNDTKTGSSLVMTVGALGASVSQRVGFGTVSSVGDTVKLMLSAPGKLLSVGLLSNIEIGTYNGAASNNDAVAINNHLISLELLSGDSQALLTFVPAAAFDQVEVRLNAGLAGVLTTVDLNYAQRIALAPTLTVANPTACENQAVTLTVNNPNSEITYTWYDSTGGKVLGTGPSFNTTATPGATFYVAAVTASGCSSYKTQVKITVTPEPKAPELVSADIETCIGTDITLSVKEPVEGIVYRWFNAAGDYQTGKDGTTFTVSNVTAAAQWSVEAFVASCNMSSATRATASITVGGLSKPIITPKDITIKSGTSAALVASSSTTGVTFKWYADPALTDLKASTSTYITEVLINTTPNPVKHIYYVTGEIAGGCPANGSATVEVTVLPHVDGTDIPCEPATIQVRDGVDGVALLADVFNPGMAVDNDTETASSLVMPVGALGASVYQHVAFKGMSVVGDTVKLRLTSPGKLLLLAVLPSIEFTTYAGLVSNNDMIVANNPLIHLELISEDTDYIFSFVPQKQFDGVEVRLRSGLAAVLSTLDFNYAQRVMVAPKVSSANVSACEGTGATLSVQNPTSGITYKWYKKDNTYLADGITYTTATDLAVGDHGYYVVADRNNCTSAKTNVTVTIMAGAAAPVEVAGNPKTTCPNEPVELAVTAVTGVTYNWYDALTGGSQLASNTSTYTTSATLAPGVHNFYVEASNANSCVSTAARTKITVTVNRLATAADVTVAGANTAVCKDNKVTLTASSTIANPKFQWFTDAALSNRVSTDAVYEPILAATTTFYVTVSGDDACEGGAASAKAVVVTVNPPATAADLNVTGNGSPLCAGAKAVLTATTSTVTNPVFVWYTDKDLKDAVYTGAVYNPVLTKTTTYWVTVSGDNKCPNLAADAKVVTVTVNDIATTADIMVAGNGTPFCAGTEATLTASSTTVTNPTFIWYSDKDLKTEVFRGPVYKPTVTVTTNYYVIVSGDNRCPNDAVNAKVVAITVNPTAIAADITVTGADAAFCEGTKAVLTASSTTVNAPVFTWYTDADLTNAVFTGPKFEPIVNGTVTYYVTVRGTNKCESVKAGAKVITLKVNPPALSTDIDIAGNDAPLCNGTEALLTASSKTVNSPVFNWYSDAALTKLVFNGPVFKPTVTGTTTYFVTVSGTNKCPNLPGDAKIVTVIVNPPAVASDIILSGGETPVCEGTTVKLTAATTTVTNPVFTWYTDEALTKPVHTGAVLEKALTETTTYYVTVKGANKCENLGKTGKAITVVVNPLPNPPSIDPAGTTICAEEATKLTIQNVQAGITYTWYNVATGGSPLGTGDSYTTGVLTTTTDFYVVATSNAGCGNATGRVKVTVTVSPKPGIPTVVASTVNTCLGSAAVLSISNPVAGVTYNWYANATSTVILGSGAQFTTPVVTVPTITYYVGAQLGNCVSASRKAVVVNAGAIPLSPPTVSGAESELCSGSSTVLTVNNPNSALKYTWYSAATGGTGLADGTTFTVPALNATTIYYVGSSNNITACESATRTAVTVKVAAKLGAPVVSQTATATSITFAWPAVTGATAYEVSMDNGLNWIAPSSGAAGTTHLVSGLNPDQKVTIRVRAKGQLDCQTSDATTFTGIAENPLGNEVFVPNTFTPNNDGKNDVLYVYGNTIAKMQLRVYNQWGQFLYESLNIQNGWDGTYKGQMQPNGVYVYYLELEFNDGTKATKKGTITILR